MSRSDLAECVRRSLDRYFVDLDGEQPCAIYSMVIAQVERPMLEVVMREANGNQTVAAGLLGINRNTLRRKLQEHKLI
ncbi:MAG TPA: helix-turn-helix domain-containing protein [Rhodocyclaceae bacterium]|jgi:Fis family transcriptional regulator|nr:helix-turn-helix domain-containing protein [Rhodocyclaceae bacterium]